MAKLYDLQGNPVVLNTQEAQQAVLAGTHKFADDQTLNVVDPGGKQTYGIAPKDLPDYLKQGYNLETPNQYKVREFVHENEGLKGTAKVAIGQFIDEANLGIPETIFSRVADPLEVEKVEALKNAHEVANTLGGVAGFAASFVNPVIAGPVGNLAKFTGKLAPHVAAAAESLMAKGIAKETAAKIATGIVDPAVKAATEGAAYAAPIAAAQAGGDLLAPIINEDSLGNPEHWGEALTTEAEGIGISLLLNGLIHGGGNVFQKLKSKKIIEGDHPFLTDTPTPSEAIKVISDPKYEEVFKMTPSKESLQGKYQEIVSPNGEKLPELSPAQLTDSVKYGIKPIDKTMELFAIISDRATMQEAENKLTQQKRFFDDYKSRGVGSNEEVGKTIKDYLQVQQEKFGKEIGEWRDANKNIKVAPEQMKPFPLNMNEVRRDFIGEDAIISKIEKLKQIYENPGDIGTLDRFSSAKLRSEIDMAYNARNGILANYLSNIKRAADESIDNIAMINKPKTAKTAYAYSKKAETADLLRGFLDETKANEHQVFNILTDSAQKFEQFENLANRMEAPELVEYLRDNYIANIFHNTSPSSAWGEMNKINKIEATKKILGEKEFKTLSAIFDHDARLKSTMPSSFNPSGTEITRQNISSRIAEAAISFDKSKIAATVKDIVAGNPRKAKLAIERWKNLTRGYTPDENVINKTSTFFLSKKPFKLVKEKLESIGPVLEEMAAGKKKFAGVLPETIGSRAIINLIGESQKEEDKRPHIDRLRDALAEAQANPYRLNNLISDHSNLLSAAGIPKIAQNYAMKSTQALNYLYSEIPKPPAYNPLFGAPKWKPSDHEIKTFSRKAEIVSNPLSVIEHLKNGTLTREHVEALKTVYPKLYKNISDRIFQNLSEKPKNFPYQTRLKLAMLMETNQDSSLSNIAILQNSYNMDNENLATKQGANFNIDLGNRYESEFNKISNRA